MAFQFDALTCVSRHAIAVALRWVGEEECGILDTRDPPRDTCGSSTKDTGLAINERLAIDPQARAHGAWGSVPFWKI